MKEATMPDPNYVANANRSTAEELEKRIKQDFNLPDDPVLNAIVYLAVADCNLHGFVEAEPIQKKYPELFCPWCGKLHRSEEHDKLSAEFLAKQEN